MIESLCVVHLQEYVKVSEQRCPVKQFVTRIKPFSASTCARHVYIFTLPKVGEYSVENLTQTNARTAEYLRGGAAYFFLLRWLVGVESHKLQHNDHFVLGKVRELWTHFSQHQSTNAAPYKQVMDLLFQDAGAIRSIIQSKQEAHTLPTDEEYVTFVKEMCANCTLAREQNMQPAYDSLEMSKENFLMQLQKNRVTLITKKLLQLQQKVSDTDLLVPSSQTLPVKLFELALTLTRKKYQPEIFEGKIAKLTLSG